MFGTGSGDQGEAIMRVRCVLACITVLFQASYASADLVGISKEEFLPHYAKQKDPLWCWAASTQMILSYQGAKVPQEEVVLRVKGALSSSAGSIAEMIAAANGVFSSRGKEVVVSGQYVHGAPLATVLYNQLSHKRPVILNYIASGSNIGHAVVVTAIDASISNGELMVSGLYVFDPFSYRVVQEWGVIKYIHDQGLITKYYPLSALGGTLYLPAGAITGVVLVDGTAL